MMYLFFTLIMNPGLAAETAEWKRCERQLIQIQTEFLRLIAVTDNDYRKLLKPAQRQMKLSLPGACPSKVMVSDMPVDLRDRFLTQLQNEDEPVPPELFSKLSSQQLLEKTADVVQKKLESKIRGTLKMKAAADRED